MPDLLPRLYAPRSKPKGAELDRDHPLARGLVGLWTFSEAGGAAVYDKVAGYVGSVTSPAWTGGPIGAALSFDGSSTAVNAGNVCAGLTTGLTIAVWFYWNAQQNTQAVLVDKGAGSQEYRLKFTGGNTLALDVPGTYPNNETATSSAISAGTWHFAVATNNAGGVGVIYVDGQQARVNNSFVAPGAATSVPLFFGNYSGGSAYFNGKIAYVGIWNRALSAQEVTALTAEPFTMLKRPSLTWEAVAPPAGSTFTDLAAMQALLSGAPKVLAGQQALLQRTSSQAAGQQAILSNTSAGVFAKETFTGITGGTALSAVTPDIGTSWQKQSGFTADDGTVTAANRVRVSSSGGLFFSYIQSSLPSADADYQCAVYLASDDTASGYVSLCGRNVGTSDTCYYISQQSVSGTWTTYIVKRINGANTILASSTVPTKPTAGSTHNWKLSIRTNPDGTGYRQQFWIDGTLVLGANDTDAALAAAGYLGLVVVGGASSGSDSTGFQVTNLQAATPPTTANVVTGATALFQRVGSAPAGMAALLQGGKTATVGIAALLQRTGTASAGTQALITWPWPVLKQDTFTGGAGTQITAHTPDTGGAWLPMFGGTTASDTTFDDNPAVITAGGGIRPTAGPDGSTAFPGWAASFYGLSNAAPSGDHVVECDFIIPPTVGGNSVAGTFGLLARMSPSQIDCYHLRLYYNSNKWTWDLYWDNAANYAGSMTGVAALWTADHSTLVATYGLPAAGASVTFKAALWIAQVNSTTTRVRAFVNGIQVADVNDTNGPQSGAGHFAGIGPQVNTTNNPTPTDNNTIAQDNFKVYAPSSTGSPGAAAQALLQRTTAASAGAQALLATTRSTQAGAWGLLTGTFGASAGTAVLLSGTGINIIAGQQALLQGAFTDTAAASALFQKTSADSAPAQALFLKTAATSAATTTLLRGTGSPAAGTRAVLKGSFPTQAGLQAILQHTRNANSATEGLFSRTGSAQAGATALITGFTGAVAGSVVLLQAQRQAAVSLHALFQRTSSLVAGTEAIFTQVGSQQAGAFTILSKQRSATTWAQGLLQGTFAAQAGALAVIGVTIRPARATLSDAPLFAVTVGDDLNV